MDKNSKIYVAGHNGLIGSAIVRVLSRSGYSNILTKNRSELDLTDQACVKSFFDKEKPEYIFLAAAKVGGIFANNTYRAEFIYENMMMQNNVIHHAFLSEVKKLMFFASADVYPKQCPQPAKEEYLLDGKLEVTCEPFALAKIAGIKMCESYNRQYGTDFIVIIPPNVYGPNQHYDIMNAQVLPSLIKRIHEAKLASIDKVVLWGTGSPVRDFLFVEDVANACIFLMEHGANNDYVNVGTGRGYTIRELAETIKTTVGYQGEIVFDKTKPDGVPVKMLDIAKMSSMGWQHKVDLAEGVTITYDAFLSELEKEEVRTTKICRIESCEKDKMSFSTIEKGRTISQNQQPADYKNKVVIKPWGYEYLVFENELVAVWFLNIKKGYSTSMHCHPLKKTSLILLSGNAMSNTFNHRNYLRGGDAIILGMGVFHSTKSLSDEGISLLEVETPPNKTDLVRLQDRYGRESSGYEGITEMQAANLEDFDFFSFEETDTYGKVTHANNKFIVTFEIFPNNDEFKKHFRIKEGELYTACRGRLLDRQDNPLLETGDSQKAEILSNIKEIHIPGKTVLLSTRTKDR